MHASCMSNGKSEERLPLATMSVKHSHPFCSHSPPLRLHRHVSHSDCAIEVIHSFNSFNPLSWRSCNINDVVIGSGHCYCFHHQHREHRHHQCNRKVGNIFVIIDISLQSFFFPFNTVTFLIIFFPLRITVTGGRANITFLAIPPPPIMVEPFHMNRKINPTTLSPHHGIHLRFSL